MQSRTITSAVAGLLKPRRGRTPLTQLYLIRHASNDWMKSGRLAGWTPEIHLNDEGRAQAEALGERLATARLRAVYSSPLERALETANAIVAHYTEMEVKLVSDLGEVQYGEWTGKQLRQLARSELWRVIQQSPARARFPAGESLREMQSRAIAAVEKIVADHPSGAVAVVSHGDVIKALVAHYAGIHLDLFQRIIISPASISIIGLSPAGQAIYRLNDTSHYDQSGNARKRG